MYVVCRWIICKFRHFKEFGKVSFAKKNDENLFFSRQIFLLYFEKRNFGGKKLLFKRVNLLYKEGFSKAILQIRAILLNFQKLSILMKFMIK
jgi:hypothetical protein